MVADDVNDFRALAAFAKELLDHIVVFLGPVDATAQGPDVDQVANEIELLKFGVPKKSDELTGLAPLGSQMHIRYPAGPIMFHRACIRSGAKIPRNVSCVTRLSHAGFGDQAGVCVWRMCFTSTA